MDSSVANAPGQTVSRKTDRTNMILGYAALFLASYIAFLFATFPYDMLFTGILRHYEKKLPEWIKPLNFESLQANLPLGATIKNLSIGKISGEPLFEVDSLDISFGLFSALAGKINTNFKAAAYGGKLSGTFVGNGNKGKLRINLSGAQVDRVPALKNFVKPGIYGKASGKLDMDWSKTWLDNKGDLSLSIEDGGVKNLSLKVLTADFKFTKVEGDFTLSNGVLTIKHLVLEGSPCGLEIEGNISPNPHNLPSSAIDLSVIFIPTPEFEKNVPFQLLQKEGEGKYKGHFGGTFSSPSFP